MTFDTREGSTADGNKVFLYTWTRGIRSWRYATTDHDVKVLGRTYLQARGMSHGGIDEGTELVRAAVDIEVPIDNPVSAMYVGYAPADSIVVDISEYHIGDETEVEPVWGGRIVGVRFNPEDGTATITHEPTYTSIKRTGLRRTYQVNCPLALYGARCRVRPADFQRVITVTDVTGATITAGEFATEHVGHWPGGTIVYQVETGVTDRRYIKSVTGSVATLNAPAIGLQPGATVTALPGCDHTLDTCIDFFHNGDNNGGFPFFGTKNPFGSDPIY
jgi:uncharacterized phage protein (TIGR02218 family)